MRAAWRLTLKRTHGGTIDRTETIAHGLRRAAQVSASPRGLSAYRPGAPVRCDHDSAPDQPANAFGWHLRSIASAMIAREDDLQDTATRAGIAKGRPNNHIKALWLSQSPTRYPNQNLPP